MTPARCALLVAALLTLPACTGLGSDDGAEPLPTISTIPAETTPPPLMPTRTEEIPRIDAERLPEDLAVLTNNDDPARTTQTASITVPAGRRLQVTALCQGTRDLQITTVPESVVEATVECEPSELGQLVVRQPRVTSTPLAYRVTVTAPAPARWYVALTSLPQVVD